MVRGFIPPPDFLDFFLKSEGKEVERKGKKIQVVTDYVKFLLQIFLHNLQWWQKES